MTSNKTFHRFLSMLLLICMLMSLSPATAFAEESAEAEEAALAETVEITAEEPAAAEEAADEPETLPAEEAAPEEAAGEPEALPAEEAAAPEEAADAPDVLPAEEAAAPDEAADEPEALPAEEAEECTITYTDGEGTVLATFTAEYGSETPTIENPTREGYRFDRWEPALEETVTGDATYVAQWVKTYTLHFAGYEAYDITVDEGETASFAFVSGGLTQKYSLKDTDEQFLGWDTDADVAHDKVSCAKYTNGQKDTNKGPFSFEMKEDVTLYPIFGAMYKLTAMHNDGTENYLNTNDAKPGTFARLMIGTRPTRSGYTLLGYARSQNATEPDADLAKAGSTTSYVYIYLEGDTTIWAVWQPISYTLTYDLNGGTGTLPDPVSFTLADGKDVTLPAAEGYAKEGEIFLGWSFGTKISDLAWNKELTTTNLKTFYEPGSSIPASALTAANKTIYAVWKYTGVTQNVDLNGGTKGPSGFPKTVNYGTSWSLPLMTTSFFKDIDASLTEDGSVKNYIRGWYVVNDGTVHPHGNTAAGANGKITITEDTTIMALYEYTVITFADGEEVLGTAVSRVVYSIPVYSFPNGDAVTPATLISAPEKEGFTFRGWAEDPSGEPVYQPGDELAVLSDTTLYAVYEINQHTVTFDANGGDSAPDSQTVDHGAVVVLEAAVRAKFDFLGWATSADATVAEFAAGDEFTVTEDVTLYAVWRHTSGWSKNDEGKWNYYDENGELLTGWLKTDSATYYLDDDGVMLTGWQEIDGETYCFNPGGSMKTGWKKIDGAWYYFGSDGKMQTGFVQTYGNSYYMDENGRMLTGWQKLDGKWYFFNKDSGAMALRWKEIDGKWYYFGEDGIMRTGWQEINGKWYYLQSSGAMKTGWLKYNNRWYYFVESGAMKTGWLKDGGYWYYFVESGAMAVSTTLTINGVKYSFDASGHML